MAILGKDDRGDAAVTQRKPQPAAKPRSWAKPLRKPADEQSDPRAPGGAKLQAAPAPSYNLQDRGWSGTLGPSSSRASEAGRRGATALHRTGEINLQETRFRAPDNSEKRQRLRKLVGDTQFDALSERGRTLRAEATELSAARRRDYGPQRRDLSQAGKDDPIKSHAIAMKHALKKADTNRAVAPKIQNDDDENVKEMTQEDFEKLSPRQRAAVMYNSQLVRTVEKDQAKGESKRTEKFLTDLGIEVGNDKDEFLQLDRAIDNSIISILDSKDAKQDSASSMRYARREDDAKRAFSFDRATNATNRAGEALANNMLARGELSLRGGKGPTSAGYSDDLRDQALRRGYSLMVDAKTEQTLDDVKQGLATLNEMNGLDITIDELLDFTRLQLDTVSFGRLGGADVRVPVWDESVTPLSVKEIRKRYGL